MSFQIKQYDWLFLEIDGVLAPENRFDNWFPNTVEEMCCFTDSCLNNLEKVLVQYPTIRIGLASSWRDQFDFESVKALFSDEVRERVVGYTPTLDDAGTEWPVPREIALFLKLHDSVGSKWMAIDPQPRRYNVKAGDPVYVVKSAATGFGEQDAAELAAMLELNHVPAAAAPKKKSTMDSWVPPPELPVLNNPSPKVVKESVSHETDASLVKTVAMESFQQKTSRLEKLSTNIANNLSVEKDLRESRELLHVLAGTLSVLNLDKLGERARVAERTIDDAIRNKLLKGSYLNFLLVDIRGFINEAKQSFPK